MYLTIQEFYVRKQISYSCYLLLRYMAAKNRSVFYVSRSPNKVEILNICVLSRRDPDGNLLCIAIVRVANPIRVMFEAVAICVGIRLRRLYRDRCTYAAQLRM